MPVEPQDHRPPARKRTAAAAKREKAQQDELLDKGIALADADGTRLQVRMRDVKGIHEAALVRETGMDFMGLLEAMSKRQGLDLFGAALWFVRLVNDRETETYMEILTRFGAEDFMALDIDEAKPEDEAPKA